MISCCFAILLFYSVPVSSQIPIELDVKNWTQILSDEWLVEFYAQWCPACQMLQPEWDGLAMVAPELGIKVAKMDCSEQSAVAMIFTITSLPTIYHVKAGVFRQVKGLRKVGELRSFIETQSYEMVQPDVWQYSPSAFYMPFAVRFLDFGMSMTRLQRKMVDDGMPAVFALILVGTGILGSGAIFGMVLLFICEYCCPPRPQILRLFGKGGERPTPLVTKENDTDNDSVLGDSSPEVSQSSDAKNGNGEETEETTLHQRKKRR